MNTFLAVLAEHQDTMAQLASCQQKIEHAARLMQTSLQAGGKILLCGNGGSAADCQHLAAELVVRYEKHRPALAALALTTDTSILTAHSNDFGFRTVFSRQVEALGQAGDVLCAISTSGNSENIIAAAQAAQHKGLTVIVLTGGSGGELAALATVSVNVPSTVTARIQEAHILIGHWWCQYLEQQTEEHA